MSLFDRLSGRKEIELSSKSALLLACITMVAADGDIDDDEIAIIRRLDGAGNTKNWDDAVKAWKKNDVNECCELVKSSLDKEHVLPMFANLIDIAMADGELAGQEKRLLEKYMALLQPDEKQIGKFVDVIQMKNSVTTI